MKAREFIDKYESYCPQELSMEGDISGLQVGSLDNFIKMSWLPWMFGKIR